MKIKNITNKERRLFSVEVFPPKNNDDIKNLYEEIEKYKNYEPDFISVTYGAGGSTRDKTLEIARHIKNQMNIEVMAHLTCVNATVAEIDAIADALIEDGIENILALRGDPPQGQENFTKTLGGFGDAAELTLHLSKKNKFSLAVAGYPEGHIQAKSLKDDVKFLKQKVDSGADLILTQLFFDNQRYYDFIDLCISQGITVPISAGVMPILNYNSIKRIASLSGAHIPAELLKQLEKNQNDKEAIEQIGMEFAITQITDLLKNNIDGIHLYTMNKGLETVTILEAIKDLLFFK